MKRSHAQHAHTGPVDIVGIPEPDLRAHLEHILDRDSVHPAEPQSLLGLAHHLEPEAPKDGDFPPIDEVEGHEDMLPQLRLVDALLGKINNETPPTERRPFAELVAAEKHRRQRRKRLSRNPDSPEELPPPSAQAENDRLLLEEIGRKPNHPNAGWTAEPQSPSATMSAAEDSPPPPSFSVGDEMMDLYVGTPPALAVEQTVTPAPEPPPPIALKVKRKEKVAPPPVAEPATPSLTDAPPASAITTPAAVKLQVKGRTAAAEPVTPPPTEAEAPKSEAPKSPIKLKGKRRRNAAAMPTLADAPAPVETVPQPPEPEAEKPAETAPVSKPAVKMKVKGKPRRNSVTAPAPTETPAPAPTETPAPVPTVPPPPEPETAKPAEAAPVTKPAVKMKVKGKPRRNSLAAPAPMETPAPAPMETPAPAASEIPVPAPADIPAARAAVPQPPELEAAKPAEAAPETKPAVKMKVKGKPRRNSVAAPAQTDIPAPAQTDIPAPAPTEIPAPVVAMPQPPEPEAAKPEDAAPETKPAVKMKVKGKPRRNSVAAPAPTDIPAPAPTEAPAPATPADIPAPVAAMPQPPEPEVEKPTEVAPADKPAVKMKVKGKPRHVPAETAPGQDLPVSAPAAIEQPTPVAQSVAEPSPVSEPSQSGPPSLDATPPAPAPTPDDHEDSPREAIEPSPSIQIDDPLQQRVEDIIAAHAQRAAPTPGAPLRGSHDLPENREALAKLLDDVQPASDFEALDLVYACWSKTTHESDSRALLAVAQQISHHFGLPDKLPMAATKAWKMLDNKVFSPELADRLAAVGQFIVDWQKTQRVFLILEFSEIELIEYLFEALSPADYPELLAEVMNFKVLSNRRMGLLRRFPARLRKQTQSMLPDRKEEALVIQAHGKALLQQIADPRGFAPIVEVAGKMLEEVEKLMKQTANAGAPPQLGGPPGGGGGGAALGRIG